MRISITHLASVAAISMAIALAAAPASAKTVKECNAEYSANKAAIKSSGQKKKDFVEACRAGTETIPGVAVAPPTPAPTAAAPARTTSVGGGKTAKECNAEYKANKAAIRANGQKKKDFIEACRSGASAPIGAAPSAVPAQKAAPVREPSEATTPAPTAAPQQRETRATPATGAGEFSTDTQAKARCPNDTVVWVNTRSHVYHFAGAHNYGTTKRGAYMCEADAKGAGDRAAENEKHP